MSVMFERERGKYTMRERYILKSEPTFLSVAAINW